jgi:predicted permease
MRLLETVQARTRSLLRAPAFVTTSVLTLGLGIGLTTAVFTVADALLLRKLPMHDQDRLVALWGEKRDGTAAHWPLGIADAREFIARARTLREAALVDFYGATSVPVMVGGGNTIIPLHGAPVSGNYFDVIGARAELGRTLARSDDVIGASPVVVLSHAAWQRDFGGDRSVIGERFRLQRDGTEYTIVGVMPAGLEFPARADFWTPYTPARLRSSQDSSYAEVDVVGRLAPGATVSSARAELSAYLSRADASIWWREFGGAAHTLPSLIMGDIRPAVLAFVAAAVLLLLITCIDVANLLLVRGLSRVRELAVRAALGATRAQLMGQLLVENTLIALAGGVVGVGVGMVSVRAFVAFAPADLPLLETVRLNGGTLAAAFAVTAAAMLLFGVAPALVAARSDPQLALKSGARQSSSRQARMAREILVAGQMALAVIVLAGATLIARSLLKLENANLRFDSSHLVIAELGLRYDRYDNLEKQLSVLRTIQQQVRAIPGVEATSPVVAVPFSGTSGWTGRAGVEGQSPVEASKNPMFNMELVTPDYFATFGLGMLRGRGLSDADARGSEAVVVISETTARSYWPGQDPIGKRLLMGGKLEQSFTVVGVVPDTRYRELREPRATVYYPLAQSIFPFAPATLAVRVHGPAAAAVNAIRRAVADAAPGVVVARGAPFSTFMEGPLAQPRLNAFLLGVFAFGAVMLTAVGIFGVMTTMVRQRTRELGIRMALGATAWRVQGMVVRKAAAIAAAGVVVGLMGALLSGRLLSTLLYDVSPADPATLAGVGLFLVALGVAVTYAPARAGARVDPVIALRADD